MLHHQGNPVQHIHVTVTALTAFEIYSTVFGLLPLPACIIWGEVGIDEKRLKHEISFIKYNRVIHADVLKAMRPCL